MSIIGALTGGAYAITQYIDNSNAERVKETLKFIERFNTKENFQAKQNIDLMIFEKISEIDKKQGEGDLSYKKYIDEIMTPQILTDFNNIFDFYDQLYVCSLSDLCNNEISIKLFGKYAYDITGTFYPLIDKNIKNGDEHFGEGILYFFNQYKVTYPKNLPNVSKEIKPNP